MPLKTDKPVIRSLRGGMWQCKSSEASGMGFGVREAYNSWVTGMLTKALGEGMYPPPVSWSLPRIQRHIELTTYGDPWA